LKDPHLPRSTRQRSYASLTGGLAVLAVLYFAGLLLFVRSLPQPADPAAPIHADAIVALTGEGGRLAPAVMLLEEGAGARLLITGVNPVTSKGDLRPLLNGGASFDCCADLGFEAANTRGNAAEAAAWARTHDYRSLIVVTADYHMPRSLLEFSAAMPGVTLVPYAVSPERNGVLQRLPGLNAEFDKYLVSALLLKLVSLMDSGGR
jgi:uncharacterized SAM-binding protein YcdF (DUF218 family)